jgi:hypothetical protein
MVEDDVIEDLIPSIGTMTVLVGITGLTRATAGDSGRIAMPTIG